MSLRQIDHDYVNDHGIRIHGIDGEMLPHEIVGNLFHLGSGQPFEFEGRRWACQILDEKPINKVTLTSRQIGKTTLGLAGDAIDAVLRELAVLYIAPLQDQAFKASEDRFEPMVSATPILRARIGEVNNKSKRKYGSRGVIHFLYASNDADRIRGITCDKTRYDEAQDIDLDMVVPIVRQVMFRSIYKYREFSGTPKGPTNGLQKLYDASKQYEWILRCGSCSKHIMIGLRNIGLRGPICHHCGAGLDVNDGFFEALNPSGKYPGYHVSQIHCIDSHRTQDDWDSILEQYEGEQGAFFNEVMGWPYGAATKPLTKEDIYACCEEMSDEWLHGMSKQIIAKYGMRKLVAGIDWGHGESETAMTIGFPVGVDKFKVTYMGAWGGAFANPEYCMPQIKEIAQGWRVRWVHADYGGGFFANETLRHDFPERYTTNYWSHSAKAADMTWKTKGENVPMCTASKTKAISALITAIKTRKIILPPRQIIEPFVDSLTGIQIERDRFDNIMFTKDGTDDVLQSLAYSWMASRFAQS